MCRRLRLEFLVDVAGHHDHFLQRPSACRRTSGRCPAASCPASGTRAAAFPCGPCCRAFCQAKYFVVHLLVERADLLDELAQIPQMAFAVGDFLVHDHAVEAFLGRLGQQFFRDGDVFLGGEAEAVNEALHLDLGLLDALADLDFLFAREQRHLAHLVHVHPHRVVQNFQAGVLVRFLLLRRFRLPGALGLGLVHDDFHVETAQLGQQRVQILRAEVVRQHVVDVVVGDVAVLLGQVQQRLDRLGQIHGRLD